MAGSPCCQSVKRVRLPIPNDFLRAERKSKWVCNALIRGNGSRVSHVRCSNVAFGTDVHGREAQGSTTPSSTPVDPSTSHVMYDCQPDATPQDAGDTSDRPEIIENSNNSQSSKHQPLSASEDGNMDISAILDVSNLNIEGGGDKMAVPIDMQGRGLIPAESEDQATHAPIARSKPRSRRGNGSGRIKTKDRVAKSALFPTGNAHILWHKPDPEKAPIARHSSFPLADKDHILPVTTYDTPQAESATSEIKPDNDPTLSPMEPTLLQQRSQTLDTSQLVSLPSSLKSRSSASSRWRVRSPFYRPGVPTNFKPSSPKSIVVAEEQEDGSSRYSGSFSNMPTISSWSSDSGDGPSTANSSRSPSYPPTSLSHKKSSSLESNRRRTLSLTNNRNFKSWFNVKSPLIEAVKLNDLQEVNELLAPDHKIHPSTDTDKDGLTALHWACRYGYVDIIQALLAHYADTEARTKIHGRTPLYYAAQYGHLASASVLIDSGACITAASGDDGSTALHKAGQVGRTSIMSLLISRGANVNAKDNEGMTPLWWALVGKQLESCRLLITNGASLDTRIKLGANLELAPELGNTCMLKAVQSGAHAFVRLFLEMGADPDVPGPFGQRALHKAAIKGDLVMVGILLEFRAEVNVRTDEGWTALHSAARRGHKRVCLMLMRFGAAEGAVTNKGETARTIAKANGFVECFT